MLSSAAAPCIGVDEGRVGVPLAEENLRGPSTYSTCTSLYSKGPSATYCPRSAVLAHHGRLKDLHVLHLVPGMNDHGHQLLGTAARLPFILLTMSCVACHTIRPGML